jgi:catechol 2,3-dioxygenase-like lactoylglutathione lyase family enzyme
MGEDLHHVAIMVDDVNRNLNVFKNLLGFTVEWHRELVDLSPLHGIPDTKAEVAYVRRSSGGVAVEFVRYLRPAMKEGSGPIGIPKLGSLGLSLVVKDLDGLYQRLPEEGFTPEAPPVRREPPGEGVLRICLFRAKEGWVLELIERVTNPGRKEG